MYLNLDLCYSRIEILMHLVSVLTHVLYILGTYNWALKIWYQSRLIRIVPWVINNAIQVVDSFESRCLLLLL